MNARPITDTDRAAVRRLHAEGTSRNDIARQLNRSPATVSKIARELGLSFARAAEVAAATEVRTADLAARRTALAETLHNVAEREIAKMTTPQLYWEWGGKDHTYVERTQPEPTPADRRTMMATASAALDRSLKLAPLQVDAAAESVSMLGDLMAGLARNYADRHGGAAPAAPVYDDDGEEGGGEPDAH